MGTIKSKLEHLANVKKQIKNALGTTITDISEYPNLIRNSGLPNSVTLSNLKKYPYTTSHTGISWSDGTMPPLPYDANGVQGLALVCNNEIHLLGGQYGITSHYKLVETSSIKYWELVSTLPVSCYSIDGFVLNGNIYLLFPRTTTPIFSYNESTINYLDWTFNTTNPANSVYCYHTLDDGTKQWSVVSGFLGTTTYKCCNCGIYVDEENSTVYYRSGEMRYKSTSGYNIGYITNFYKSVVDSTDPTNFVTTTLKTVRETSTSPNDYFISGLSLWKKDDYIYCLGGKTLDKTVSGYKTDIQDYVNTVSYKLWLQRYNISDNTWEDLTSTLQLPHNLYSIEYENLKFSRVNNNLHSIVDGYVPVYNSNGFYYFDFENNKLVEFPRILSYVVQPRDILFCNGYLYGLGCFSTDPTTTTYETLSPSCQKMNITSTNSNGVISASFTKVPVYGDAPHLLTSCNSNVYMLGNGVYNFAYLKDNCQTIYKISGAIDLNKKWSCFNIPMKITQGSPVITCFANESTKMMYILYEDLGDYCNTEELSNQYKLAKINLSTSTYVTSYDFPSTFSQITESKSYIRLSGFLEKMLPYTNYRCVSELEEKEFSSKYKTITTTNIQHNIDFNSSENINFLTYLTRLTEKDENENRVYVLANECLFMIDTTSTPKYYLMKKCTDYDSLLTFDSSEGSHTYTFDGFTMVVTVTNGIAKLTSITITGATSTDTITPPISIPATYNYVNNLSRVEDKLYFVGYDKSVYSMSIYGSEWEKQNDLSNPSSSNNLVTFTNNNFELIVVDEASSSKYYENYTLENDADDFYNEYNQTFTIPFDLTLNRTIKDNASGNIISFNDESMNYIADSCYGLFNVGANSRISITKNDYKQSNLTANKIQVGKF